MPTASDAQRARWGEDGGPGEGKAIAYLEAKGFKLTHAWTWVKPAPGYEMTEDDWGAIGFLIDEWDFGGLEPLPRKCGQHES